MSLPERHSPRVAHFPPRAPENPYIQLLCDALRECGVSIVPHPGRPSILWLLRMGRTVDILHFHWPEIHYQRSSTLLTLLKFGHFAAFLLAAIILGHTVVWTVHNLEPHESSPLVDRWARRLMARAAWVVAHCQWAAEEARRRWRLRREILVAHHGHYIGRYPDGVSRDAARWQLGLPLDARVFLHLGALRRYKGVENLMSAFQQLDGAHLRLLIAGQVRDETLGEAIRQQAIKDPRIIFHPGFVPEHMVQLYLRAADMMVLPYTAVTTSGSLMLALSFGCGVVAPSMGCIPEMIDTSAGFLYNPEEEGGLLKALRQAMETDSRVMGTHARALAERLGWREVAKKHAEFYRRIHPGKGSVI
jgi:beta-1,4-mannosyltransferase